MRSDSRARTPARGTAIVFGEVLIDVYHNEEVVAGALLHVASHLAALGWKTHFVTRIGADSDGARIRAVLARYNLDGDFVEVDPELPTGRVTVSTEDGENRFTIHRPAAWDAIECAASPPPHDVFCYGTLAARDERTRATLRRLLSSSGARLKALDMNLRPPDVDADVLRLALEGASVLKLNEEELDQAARILGLRPFPGSYFEAAPGLEWLCVTRGPKGASLHDRSGGTWTIAGAEVEVVDTVGAGDAFMAGLVDALAGDAPPRAALAAATDCAVSVLTARGGLPGAERRAARGTV
jgi:fructokinase